MQITINAVLLHTFETFGSWVSGAERVFAPYSKQMKIDSISIICIDANGSCCNIGKQWMYARDNGLFPVKVYRIVKSDEKDEDIKKPDPSAYVIPGLRNIEFKKKYTKEQIEGAVCIYFRMSREELLSPTRAADIVEPRQIAQYLMYRGVHGATYVTVGQHFKYKDSSVIGHNIKRIEGLLETESEMRHKVNEIILLLKY